MPELDDATLERRLRGVLKEHLDALPLDLTIDDLDRRREPSGVARRSGRGRSMTLLAAAALVLVGGALAAGSGILRLPTVVPPVPEPSVVAVATASSDATSPSPSESAAPSASPIPVAGPGGVWIPTASMRTPRSLQVAVRLLDGRVLVAGGRMAGGKSGWGESLTSAELYDPATGTWSATGKLVEPADAYENDATLLGDGKVLVTSPNSAQLYDPASGTWTGTGKMTTTHGYAAVTLLRDGRVLAVGIGGAEVYDPASGTWTATRKMIRPRTDPIATLLADGRVLVAGGEDGLDDWPKAAEVFDPVTGSWTGIADLPSGTPGQSLGIAMQLPDGKVLVYSYRGAEVYDPTAGTWTARPMPIKRLPDPTALLSDGTVLAGECADALYDPQTGSLTTASSVFRCYEAASFTLLLDGTVLKAGGRTCNEGGSGVCVSTGAAELYVPADVSPPPLQAFPTPAPPVFPDPTPTLTPAPQRPPAAGPVPPNARSWTITVDNESTEPATLFVAEGDDGETFRLVGSATPNVVPAGTSMKVTFLFPAKGSPDVGWISVNPRLDEGADVGSTGADDIGRPGKIWITDDCGGCWVGPASP